MKNAKCSFAGSFVGLQSQSDRAHWLFSLALVNLIIIASSCAGPQHADLGETIAWVEKRHPQVTHINLEDVQDIKNVAGNSPSVLIFDVRDEAEFAVSHLPHAHLWQGAGQAAKVISQHNIKNIVLYCSVGERSSIAAAELGVLFPDLAIANMRGGVFAWSLAELPLINNHGQTVSQVHPYNQQWGALLPDDKISYTP